MTNRINDLLITLVACVESTLEARGLPPVNFAGVLPGDSAITNYVGDGENCGMAWVRLVSAFPASGVGVQNTEPGNCSSELGVLIEVGIARCVGVGDEDGTPPSNEEMMAAAELQSSDAMAVIAAIACCPGYSSKDWILGTYTPAGPLGGVVGGAWQVQMVA